MLFLPNSSYIEAESKSEEVLVFFLKRCLLMCALTFKMTSALAIVKVFPGGIKK